MSNIPPELLQLWAECDRGTVSQEQQEQQEFDDDDSPLLFFRDEFDEESPQPKPLPPKPVLSEVTPMPSMNLFPVYSLKPPTIHPGTYHGRPPGNS